MSIIRSSVNVCGVFIFTIMANSCEPGPSGLKKRKITKVRNPKNLTVEEMMAFLYNSDAESDQEFDKMDECK